MPSQLAIPAVHVRAAALLAVVLLATTGCKGGEEGSHNVWVKMSQADSVVIYSISPERSGDTDSITENSFMGYDIIDSKMVDSKADIGYLSGILYKCDMTNNDIKAMCFRPRHAFKYNEGWALVCFECLTFRSSYGDGDLSPVDKSELEDFYTAYDVNLTPAPDADDTEGNQHMLKKSSPRLSPSAVPSEK